MSLRTRGAVFLALALCASMAFAQGTTTGALGGVVTDADNAALPGVNVEAVHQPTGTRYTTVTVGSESVSELPPASPLPRTVTV